MRSERPEVLGTRDCVTSLYLPKVDASIDVMVGYSIDGYKDIVIHSVHHYFSDGSWSEDFLEHLDEEQIEEIEDDICQTAVEWATPCGCDLSGNPTFREW